MNKLSELSFLIQEYNNTECEQLKKEIAKKASDVIMRIDKGLAEGEKIDIIDILIV